MSDPPTYYRKASWNLAAVTVLPIIDALAVGLRLYARRKQKLPLKLDDWLTIPALVCLISNVISSEWDFNGLLHRS